MILTDIPNEAFTPCYEIRREGEAYDVRCTHSFSFGELTINKFKFEQRFPSLSALFQFLVYNRLLDEASQKGFEEYVEKIFFNRRLPPLESIEILKSFLRQCNSSLNFSVEQRFDDVVDYIRNQIGAVPVGRGSHTTLLPLSTFEECLDACTCYNIQVSSRKHWVFHSDIEFFFWTLEQIISSNSLIYRCAFCGRYFVPNHLGTKYCSSGCSYVAQLDSRFCGNADIKRQYHKVYQALQRKLRSNQSYRYVSPEFSNNFHSDALFKYCSIPQGTAVRYYGFTKNDFAKIHKAFIEENKNYYAIFQTAAIDFKDGIISHEEFRQAEKQYMDWLINVRALISAFCY